MPRSISSLLAGSPLPESSAHDLMAEILAGNTPAEVTGAILTCYCFRSPSAQEIAGFARALRAQMVEVHPPLEQRDRLVDVCGTGGAGRGTFNISTATAFVAAASGLPVAKHGNRAVSSRSGSFDLLEALGLPFSRNPEEALGSLETHGLTFLYAPSFHPALARLAPIRHSLGFRTIFNLLGPLLNPMGVKRQVLGVYSAPLVVPMAEALRELGATEALVVHGDDGSDELSLTGFTSAAHLKNGHISLLRLAPEHAGLDRCDAESLRGGTAMENARIVQNILEGQGGPRRDVVLLNASAALLIGGKAESLRHGCELARVAIQRNAAIKRLDQMRTPAAPAREA